MTLYSGVMTFLLLNITKTKLLCIDFRRKQTPPKPIFVKGYVVVRDDAYIYLDIMIDSKLKWHENTANMMNKK